MLTIRFFGTHDPRFGRTALLREGLSRHGYRVTSQTRAAWGPTADRVTSARRGLANPGLAWRLAAAYVRLARELPGLEDGAPLVLGYPGQLDAVVLRALGYRGPLVLDGFVSLDETLADRQLGAPAGGSRTIARLLDRLALRLADLVIVDTGAHARRLAGEAGLDVERAVVVPVGAADPGELPSRSSGGDSLHALYFGGFIPLHGVPIVLEAARRLPPNARISFELVGNGQHADLVERCLARQPLDHVQLTRTWMSERDLVALHVGAADLCLGVFAASRKAMDVVPAKVYLALACGRAVVTADSPAVREELLAAAADGPPPLIVCEPGSPGSLAEALLQLRDDPDLRSRTAEAGRALYAARFTPEEIVRPLVDRLASLNGRR